MHSTFVKISEILDISYDDVHDIYLGNITEPAGLVREVLELIEENNREVRVYTREVI